MPDQRCIWTAKRYSTCSRELHTEIDEISSFYRLIMLIVVDDRKSGMRRGPRGIEPRDDGFGAIEKGCYVIPLSVILVEPLNFRPTCSAATPKTPSGALNLLWPCSRSWA
jgi:hypothetical protein